MTAHGFTFTLCNGFNLCNVAHGFHYRIVGYFRGVLIFVIFVVNPGVTKFCTHEIFNPHYMYSSVYTC